MTSFGVKSHSAHQHKHGRALFSKWFSQFLRKGGDLRNHPLQVTVSVFPFSFILVLCSFLSLGWVAQCDTCGYIGIYRARRIYPRISTHLVGRQRLMCGNFVANPQKYENYVKGIEELDEEEKEEALYSSRHVMSGETRLIHSSHWSRIFGLIQLSSCEDFCLKELEGLEEEDVACQERNFTTKASEGGDDLSQLFVDENLMRNLASSTECETVHRAPPAFDLSPPVVVQVFDDSDIQRFEQSCLSSVPGHEYSQGGNFGVLESHPGEVQLTVDCMEFSDPLLPSLGTQGRQETGETERETSRVPVDVEKFDGNSDCPTPEISSFSSVPGQDFCLEGEKFGFAESHQGDEDHVELNKPDFQCLLAPSLTSQKLQATVEAEDMSRGNAPTSSCVDGDLLELDPNLDDKESLRTSELNTLELVVDTPIHQMEAPSPGTDENSNSSFDHLSTATLPPPQHMKDQENFIPAMKWSVLHPIFSLCPSDPIEEVPSQVKQVIPFTPKKRLKRLLSGALKKA
jgi:hypothetical protein